MKKVWNFLQGKKSSIATILGAIIIYLLNNGYLSSDEAQLISVILAALGLSANITSNIQNARKIKGDKQ